MGKRSSHGKLKAKKTPRERGFYMSFKIND